MRIVIIIVLLIIVGSVVLTRDLIYTNHDSDEFYYKVDKIEPHRDGNVAVYYINSRDDRGAKRSMEGAYDNLQILDTIGAFNIGDEIILVPTKKEDLWKE